MTIVRRPFPVVTPVLFNGYALVVNTGLNAILGVFFWMAATRLFSVEQVGLGAALISSMTTISYFAQMNLGSFLTRFLPTAGIGGAALIARTYGTAGLVAACAATIFAVGIGSFAEQLEVVRTDTLVLILFVIATALWTIFALQDSALSGLRRSELVPIENAIYSLLKIGLLVVFGSLAFGGPTVIFLAWTVPLLPVVLAVNALILGSLKRRPRGAGSGEPDLGSAARFLGWEFVGSLALGTAFGLAPLIVTAWAGVEATASYHLAWSFAYSVYLVGRAMSVSLIAEGASHPVRLRRLVADTLSHSLLLVLGAVLVFLVYAPQIMGVFGADYVTNGAPILRVLILSCLPWAVTTIYCAVARVRRKTRTVALVQLGTLVVFVVICAALGSRFGALGVAFAWFAAHSTVCALVVGGVLFRDGSSGFMDWMLALAGSGGRLAAGLSDFSFRGQRMAPPVPEEVREGISRSDFRGLSMTPLTGSLSDVTVILLSADDQPFTEVRAVLKIATSAKGSASLQRNSAALRALAADDRLGPLAVILPRLLLEETWGDTFCTVETAVSGTEGRHLLRVGHNAADLVAVVAGVLADLHLRTARLSVMDEAWSGRWIDTPAHAVARAVNRGGSAKGNLAALENLQRALRMAFVGQEARLGLGHGDIWPGNLFYSSIDESSANVRLTGLIDWDTFRPDALAAFDACHLALTFLMDQCGEELGPVVRRLLGEGQLTREETAILDAAGLDDVLGRNGDLSFGRAILLLTWLNHVATVIGKSGRSSQSTFWTVLNVERVLETIAKTTDWGHR